MSEFSVIRRLDGMHRVQLSVLLQEDTTFHRQLWLMYSDEPVTWQSLTRRFPLLRDQENGQVRAAAEHFMHLGSS